jgi:hypothetical protein
MSRHEQKVSPAAPEPGRPATSHVQSRHEAILDLQRRAGNRAVGRLLARQVLKDPDLPPADPQGDLVFAENRITDFYEAAGLLVDLEEKVKAQAIDNYNRFKELKDPPSIAAAVFAEIFSQIVGAIPGGKFVTAGVTAGVFAMQMAKFERELDAYAIPGVSVEDERRKGPSAKTKAKVEKAYGKGKEAAGAGKAVVRAGLEAAKKRAAASAAEAAAVEAAAMQSNRISVWREARNLLMAQKKALRDKVEVAYRKGADPGKLVEFVEKQLGQLPKLDAQQQAQFERNCELALYRPKLRLATVKTETYYGSVKESEETRMRLELVGGDKPSEALLRRMAHLLEHDELAKQPLTLGAQLGAWPVYREEVKWRPAQRAGGPV